MPQHRDDHQVATSKGASMPAGRILRFRVTLTLLSLSSLLMIPLLCAGGVEEVQFPSGEFLIVGDLRTPDTEGPYPAIIMIHGDGRVNRSDSGEYAPCSMSFFAPATRSSLGTSPEPARQSANSATVLGLSSVEPRSCSMRSHSFGNSLPSIRIELEPGASAKVASSSPWRWPRRTTYRLRSLSAVRVSTALVSMDT